MFHCQELYKKNSYDNDLVWYNNIDIYIYENFLWKSCL